MGNYLLNILIIFIKGGKGFYLWKEILNIFGIIDYKNFDNIILFIIWYLMIGEWIKMYF